MEYIKKEREKIEELSKEAMIALSIKDDIINDLKIQLDIEHQENTNLRLKVKELESKLIMIDENLDLDDDKLRSSLNSKKSSTFNKNFFKNLNNSVEVKQENKDYNVRNLIEESKLLFEENNILREKLKDKDSEIVSLVSKTQKLQELDILNQQKIEAQRIKLEQSEIILSQLKDRESYIDELINRYKTIENEYENSVIAKDMEIRNLNNKIEIQNENIESLTNQINFLSQNSNTMTQDLIREIRLLEEKNKDLEMKIYKNEFVYKEEIKSLNKSLQESESKFLKHQKDSNVKSQSVSESCHLPEPKTKNPSDMKVEDLTKSLSKSIQDKVDNQSKIISNQNVELINLKYEKERLTSELALEKQTNQKLQQSLAEQKFKVSNSTNKKVECEESAMQTVIKSTDIDQDKRRIKTLEQENNDLTEKMFNIDKENGLLREKITSLGGENSRLCNELNLIIRKNERNKKMSKLENYDQDLLYNISNISKLQTTISQMKLRENELLERIHEYEHIINSIKETNNNTNQPNVTSNYNLTENKNFTNNQPNSAKSNNSPNFNSTGPLQQTRFFSSGLNVNCNPTSSKNIKEESNILVSFNVSDESIERERGQLNVKTSQSIVKSQANTNVEMELKRITEDNIYLKEQNFRYISELQRLQDNLNFYKLQLTNKDEEIDGIIKEKNILSENLNLKINELERRADNSSLIEEFKLKLMGFSDLNNQLNEQFLQLQQKFHAQNELVNKKNIEISELGERLQSLEQEKKNLLNGLDENNDKITHIEEENYKLKDQINNLLLVKDDMGRYIDNTLHDNESHISQLENKLDAVISDNTKLCEINNKLKAKVKELYDDLRNKEEMIKITKNLSQNEEILKKELTDIRKENESLQQKKQELKLENNDLKYEVKLLKDKLHYNPSIIESKSSGLPSKFSTSFENSVSTNIPSTKMHKRSWSKINTNNNTNDDYYMLKEENYKLSVEIEDYKNKLYEKENEIRGLYDRIQACEVDKDRIKGKSESEVGSLLSELNLIKGNNDNLSSIQKFLEDIKEKNQTISHLLEENSELKKEITVLKDNHELTLKGKCTELVTIKENMGKVKDEYEKYKEKVEDELYKLRNNHEEILQEKMKIKKESEEYRKEKIDTDIIFEEKIKEYEKIIQDLQNELNKTSEERNSLTSELKEVTIKHCKDYESLKEKLMKNKLKIDKIIQIYESHITFLQQRYKSNINELLNALNQKNLGKEVNIERLIKNLDNMTLMINDISQREAVIESLKLETKQQKYSIKTLNSNVKKLTKEIEELKEQLNIKSLQKKINISQSNSKNNEIELLNKLVYLKEILQENTAARLEEQKLTIQLRNKENEIRFIKQTLENTDKDKFDIESHLLAKDNEIKQKECQIIELHKNYKNDLQKATEEILHIKEKWVTPEKWLDTINQISNLEKTIKAQKEDINRKKELIIHLKTTNENQIKNKNNSNNETEIANLNEKIKSLNKELTRSQNYIKELKQSNDTLKSNEKKNTEEISSLTEKLKIMKIDITRKEEMLKNTKDKLSAVSDEQTNKTKSGQTEDLPEKLKKAKLEVERKEMTIKTLKAKLDTHTFEIEQLKSENMKLSKSNLNEIDKELKLHEIARTKADSYHSYAENLVSVLKRIFKDLVTHYESLRSRLYGDKNDTYNRFKEGMEILNMKQSEFDDIVSNEKQINIYDKILKMMDNSNYFDVSQIVETFINLKEKIIGLYRNNVNSNSDNLNTFTNTISDLKPQSHPITKYENFLSKIKDNSKNKEVINEMENLMKNLKNLSDSK